MFRTRFLENDGDDRDRCDGEQEEEKVDAHGSEERKECTERSPRLAV